MCCSIATNWILIPNGLSTPGITGISMTLEHFTGINYALIYYAITILILVLTYFTLGKKDASNIVILSILYPMVLWVLSFIDVQIIFEDKLVAIAAFGVVYGTGIGIPYRIGFSYGGDDTVAKILKKCVWKSVELKKIMYGEEALVILFMATVFDLNAAAIQPGCGGLCPGGADHLRQQHELCDLQSGTKALRRPYHREAYGTDRRFYHPYDP